MLSIILKTLSGIGLTGLSFYISYLYLKGAEDGATPLLLLLSLLPLIFGVYLLLSAGKSNASVAMAPDDAITQLPLPTGPGLEEVLKNNEQMVAAWGDTVSKRDKLKMLEISANAEKSNLS